MYMPGNMMKRAKNKNVLIVIPHNMFWVGSTQPIVEHPAFKRKLSYIADLFNLIIIFIGGNEHDIKYIKHDDVKTIIIQVKYTNILLYSLRILIWFLRLLVHFHSKRIKNIVLYVFDHGHLYPLLIQILCKLLGCKIISFYVIKPFNFKEKIIYFISKYLDDLSLVNHPLLARDLKLRRALTIIIPNYPQERDLLVSLDELSSIDELIQRKKPFLVYVGRLSYEKNPELVLYIFREIHNICKYKGLELSLLIVGDGPLRRNLEELSVRLGINDYVMFLGHKRLEEVFEIVRQALMLIHMSLYEYFPNVVIEAMSMGTLVVTPNLPQYKWISGLTLIDFNDIFSSIAALCEVLRNKELYKQCFYEQLKRLIYLKNLYEKNIVKLRSVVTKFLH